MNKPKLLMVDEDKDFFEIIKMKFEAEGFDVMVANIPQVGLRIAQENNPDLILLDMNMPGMNGIEFLVTLKGNPATKNMKVMFYTSMANAWKENTKMSSVLHDLGAIDFIEKSADLDDIVNKAREALISKEA